MILQASTPYIVFAPTFASFGYREPTCNLVELFVGPLSTLASSQFEVTLANDANVGTNTLSVALLRRAVELWPYVFMAISVAGFA